jgi:hypothetical protein
VQWAGPVCYHRPARGKPYREGLPVSKSKGPRLSGQLRAMVSFARFAQEHKLDPVDLAELLALARKAFNAGERACSSSGHDAAERRTGEAFEAKAKALGFGVQWPGLWPTLLKGNHNVYLPEVP